MNLSKSALDPEKVAYWYLRLNGFLQLENFYIHPAASGGARTDADLLGVRFPYRAERFVDDANDVMADDEERLRLSNTAIDIVIAEVKRGPCALNGPWSSTADENIQRVLSAIGCVPTKQINEAAEAIYKRGIFADEIKGIRVRLLCIGAEVDQDLAEKFPDVVQIAWTDVLKFIFQRFHTYARQKTQTELWDDVGRQLKAMVARQRRNEKAFITQGLSEMTVNPRYWPDTPSSATQSVAKAASLKAPDVPAARKRS